MEKLEASLMKEIFVHLDCRSLAICIASVKRNHAIGKENVVWRRFCTALRQERLKTLTSLKSKDNSTMSSAIDELIERCREQPDGEPTVLEKGQVLTKKSPFLLFLIGLEIFIFIFFRL